jgi:SecD/SecF fusion protein
MIVGRDSMLDSPVGDGLRSRPTPAAIRDPLGLFELTLNWGGSLMGPCFTRKIAVALAILTAMAIPHLRAQDPEDKGPVRLEFRILANTKHDREAAEKAKAADSLEHPPAGYRWVWLGQRVTGSDPKVASKRLTAPGAHWKDDEFAGGTVRLTGKNLAGTDLSRDFPIVKNTADTLHLREDLTIFLKSVSSFRIDSTPGDVGHFLGDDVIVREIPEAPRRLKRSVLVKLDRHNVSEKHLRRVVPDVDERLNPAVRFEFSREGANKFGALTREHLPEADGTFKYQMGIILDGRLLSAPVLNSEIRDAGIIELGRDARPEEVERIIKILRASGRK